MKFLYTFLLLLSIFSFVYSDDCEEQKKEYKDCIDAYKSISESEGDFKTLCSKKCKKFFNDPESTIPKCSESSSYRSELKDSSNSVKSNISLICATDEEGENCPNTQALIDHNFNKNKSDAERIADKTCKSKSCTDALIGIYRTSLEDYALDIVNKLNSKECTAQHSNSSSSSSNRSTTTDQSNSNQNTKKDSDDGPNWFTEIIMYIIIIIVLLVILFLLLPKSCTKCFYSCFDSLLRSHYANSASAKAKQNTEEDV